MTKIYSEETIKQVADAYVSGKKMSEITEMYGVPHGSIHALLDTAGVARRYGKKAHPKKCPNCGRESKERTARFCCWCGTPILTEQDKIIEKAEKLFPMCAFAPETSRDEMQQTIKYVIAYIKENCKG